MHRLLCYVVNVKSKCLLKIHLRLDLSTTTATYLKMYVERYRRRQKMILVNHEHVASELGLLFIATKANHGFIFPFGLLAARLSLQWESSW